MRSTSIALLALPLVLAQSSTTSSASAGATHEVEVGKDGLKFTPDTLTAKVGDVVKFDFYPRRHSVAQSTFDAPCLPRDQGIFSGYVSEDDGEADHSFTVPINSTDAIWIYCSAEQHCQNGMVMVINPVGGMSATSLDNYKQAAAKATENRGPANDAISGGVWVENHEDDDDSSSTASGSSATATSSSGSSQSTSGSSGDSSSSASATSSGSSSTSTVSASDNAAPGLKVNNVLPVMVAGFILGASMLI